MKPLRSLSMAWKTSRISFRSSSESPTGPGDGDLLFLSMSGFLFQFYTLIPLTWSSVRASHATTSISNWLTDIANRDEVIINPVQLKEIGSALLPVKKMS